MPRANCLRHHAFWAHGHRGQYSYKYLRKLALQYRLPRSGSPGALPGRRRPLEVHDLRRVGGAPLRAGLRDRQGPRRRGDPGGQPGGRQGLSRRLHQVDEGQVPRGQALLGEIYNELLSDFKQLAKWVRGRVRVRGHAGPAPWLAGRTFGLGLAGKGPCGAAHGCPTGFVVRAGTRLVWHLMRLRWPRFFCASRRTTSPSSS